jgi:hypothetical protein
MNTSQSVSRRFAVSCAILFLGSCVTGCQQVSEVDISSVSTAQAATIKTQCSDTPAFQSNDVVAPDTSQNAVAAAPIEEAATLLALAPEATSETPATPQRPQNITFDKIKFEMEKGAPFKRTLITPEIEKLNGHNIRIRGYILPTSVLAETGVRFFVLVRDNQECCFGPGAMLYDCVMVYMNPGKTTNYTTGVVTVEGKFTIEVNADDDGKTLAIYRLDADSAK